MAPHADRERGLEERQPLVRGSAPATRSMRAMSLDAAIVAVRLLLSLVDAVLRILCCAFGTARARLAWITRRLTRQHPQPHVVIVGGSFAGLACARALASRAKVTLVDYKTYFEYTPGVLRCYTDPTYLDRITCALPRSRNAFIAAEAVGVRGGALLVRETGPAPSSEERAVPFDFLVLAAGSTYAQQPIKPSASEPTIDERRAAWVLAASRLSRASSVAVVGGGAVGVELAAEILSAYPTVQLTIVTRGPLLAGFDTRAADYCRAWLESHGAEIMLGESAEELTEESVLLGSGRLLRADAVFSCMGATPNSGPVSSSPLAAALAPRGALCVDDHLRVVGYPHVYCVGDMMHHVSSELKLGHTAELNAHLAASNIAASATGAPLLRYPHGVVGAAHSPMIYCISLGKYDAVMGFNGLVLSGCIAALMKWLLEWTKVAAAAERPVGILFWEIADHVSALLSRTVLPRTTSPTPAESPHLPPDDGRRDFAA